MPKLDGVSATSLIRQFDADTPIISMTANSKPDEIMTYFSHGMNDILPKPFTKQGLLEMLTRHLGAFRAIQDAGHLPRALGPPSASIEEADGDEAVLPSANAAQQQDDDEAGKIDPLVAMGLTGGRYGMILSAMAGFGAGAGAGVGAGVRAGALVGKRTLEDGEQREGKRGRFEVVE
jgi:osomolarity two-component system response regulator SKN7